MAVSRGPFRRTVRRLFYPELPSQDRSQQDHYAQFRHAIHRRHATVMRMVESSAVSQLPFFMEGAADSAGTQAKDSHVAPATTNFEDDWETDSWTSEEHANAWKYYDLPTVKRQANYDRDIPAVGGAASGAEYSALERWRATPLAEATFNQFNATIGDDRRAREMQPTAALPSRPQRYTTGDALVDRRLKFTYGGRDAVLPRCSFDDALEERSRIEGPLARRGEARHSAAHPRWYPVQTVTPSLAPDPVNSTMVVKGKVMPVPHRQFSTLPYLHLRGTANHFDHTYTDESVVLQQERSGGQVDTTIPDEAPPRFFESKALPHYHEHKMKHWTDIWERNVHFMNQGQQLSRLVQWERELPPQTSPRFWYDNILKAFTHEKKFLPIPDTPVHGLHFEPWRGPMPHYNLPTFNYPPRPTFLRFWPPAANNHIPGGVADEQKPGPMTWPPQRLADLRKIQKMQGGASRMPMPGSRRWVHPVDGSVQEIRGVPGSTPTFWATAKERGGKWQESPNPHFFPVPSKLYDFAFPYNRPVDKRITRRSRFGHTHVTDVPFGNDDVSEELDKKKK
eukprot:TRINITY_DN4933_c0_g1_i1.p1 TRINITY_DN4933_c0_g1~~TRINITY_DN4933_c0_g1_i1.p1  ORF type:complete len:565 (-),score=98.24 TRINITY_DN4933_c0_g1_i1:77-1771(-)